MTRPRAGTCGFDGFYPIPIEPARFVARLEPFLTRQPVAQNQLSSP
jgi:hypothetical protein